MIERMRQESWEQKNKLRIESISTDADGTQFSFSFKLEQLCLMTGSVEPYSYSYS